MMFSVVILAGGLATRLRPLTEKTPKSLIEVNGEPFIAHQLRLLRQKGIREVTLCLGYLGERVVDYVDTGKQFDMNVSYSFDGPQLLGTGGAIKKALPLLSDSFFVVYGDSYLPCDYLSIQKTFIGSQKLALMTVFCNQGQWDKSNVQYANNKILIYDKQKQLPTMKHIDYGLGIFNKSAFDIIPDNAPYDLALLYQVLLKQDQLAAYEVTNRFYEVGSFSGIKELTDYFCDLRKINELSKSLI